VATPPFVLVNQSAAVSDDQLSEIAAALLLQIQRDLAPAWNLDPAQFAVEIDNVIPASGVPVLLSDVHDPAVLGYHEAGPVVVVYAGETVAWPNPPGSVAGPYPSLSTILSHELCETVVDWGADQYDVLGYFEEVCDPVQETSYLIDGVAVSNFVWPQWFLQGSPGPFDQMGLLKADHTLTPQGYATVLGASGLTAIGAASRPILKKPLRTARLTAGTRLGKA
jgi:hypothetical protein